MNGWRRGRGVEIQLRVETTKEVGTEDGNRPRPHFNGQTLNPCWRSRDPPGGGKLLTRRGGTSEGLCLGGSRLAYVEGQSGQVWSETNPILTVSLQTQYSWTIPSGSWTHRRAHFKGDTGPNESEDALSSTLPRSASLRSARSLQRQ